MNIAVNTRLLLKDKLEGIGWFSFETLKHITISHPEHTFYFIFDRPYDKSFIFSDNIVPIVAGLPTRHPFLWYLWMEITIPRVLKKINADLFLSTDGFLSLKSNVPQVGIIHDINFVHNPKQLPFWVRKFYNRYFIKYANKAKHLGTVSEYSKHDITETFDINPDKITVCYNGSNSVYSPIATTEQAKIREEYTGGNEYFIFVGALNPRKNIPGLLKSFEIFKDSGDFKQKLVIVGSAMHLTEEIDATLNNMKHKNDVIFTGRLSVDKLHKLLASSIALVFIPFFEGFGIPLVEAMYSETAIISGNATSLPEVVGNAALLSDANDYKKVSQHMQELVNNPELRQMLIDKGKIQRQKFSWEKSGERLWECVLKGIEAK